MRRAAQALAFLTPVGGPATPSPGALAWFPAVGAALGLALGAVWWGAGRLWAAPVAAAVVVVADLGLTGMLHLDGLADAADGLLPPFGSAERRLAVMSDPTVGAFGVGAVAAVLLLRWAALAAMPPSAPLLAALWCASRLQMAETTRRVPYARRAGLASAFIPHEGRRRLPLAGIALGAAAVALGAGADAVPAVVACGLAGMAVVALAGRRVGGFTGDVLGAAGMVGETVGLLVAAARR